MARSTAAPVDGSFIVRGWTTRPAERVPHRRSLANGTAVSVSLFRKLPFDPLRDFVPISSLGYFDFIFATSAVHTLRENGGCMRT